MVFSVSFTIRFITYSCQSVAISLLGCVINLLQAGLQKISFYYNTANEHTLQQLNDHTAVKHMYTVAGASFYYTLGIPIVSLLIIIFDKVLSIDDGDAAEDVTGGIDDDNDVVL